MTTKKNKDIYVKKSRHSRRTIAVFWISLILVLLPIVILGWMIGSAALDTHKPVFGDRYDGDLDPAITSDDLKTIDASVSALDGVQSEFTTLATATLRVYAKVDVSQTSDTATALAQQIYTTVSETLDPGVYFTQADGKKMYDLEIHVYNMGDDEDRTADNFVYVIGTKTSSMDEPAYQTVSEARYPELAEQLRAEVEQRKAEEAAASASPETSAPAE